MVAAALLLLAPAADAHDFWIQPSSFRPASDERVDVQLMVGMQGQGEAVARNEARIVRFALVTPEATPERVSTVADRPVVLAESPIVGQDGQAPAGWLRPTQTGRCVLVYTATPARIELDAVKFEAYLREEGLDAIVAQRAERGLSDKPAREVYSRCAKAMLDVQPIDMEICGPGSSVYFTPLGLPLELLWDDESRRGSEVTPDSDAIPLPVLLLLEGQPLAGALVRAVRLGAPDTTAASDAPDAPLPSARTDARGRCELLLPGRGRWMLATVHMREAPAGANADYESLWASLTFEVPPVAPQAAQPAEAPIPVPAR